MLEKRKRITKKGFTLIEIIVVVVILAVLMAVAVPSVLKYIGEADNAKYITQARGAFSMTETYLIKAAFDVDGLTQQDINNAMLEAANNLGSQPNVHAVYPIDRDSGVTITPATAGQSSSDVVENIGSYTITFDGDWKNGLDRKYVIFTPNGNVEILEHSD